MVGVVFCVHVCMCRDESSFGTHTHGPLAAGKIQVCMFVCACARVFVCAPAPCVRARVCAPAPCVRARVCAFACMHANLRQC